MMEAKEPPVDSRLAHDFHVALAHPVFLNAEAARNTSSSMGSLVAVAGMTVGKDAPRGIANGAARTAQAGIRKRFKVIVGQPNRGASHRSAMSFAGDIEGHTAH